MSAFTGNGLETPYSNGRLFYTVPTSSTAYEEMKNTDGVRDGFHATQGSCLDYTLSDSITMNW